MYLQGLLLDGERKSIEPLSRRVLLPGWHGETEQVLQLFVNQSAWHQAAVLHTYRALLAATFAAPAAVLLIDDTGFAEKGTPPVGVARQYSGTLGKQDNGHIAVPRHSASARDPAAIALLLPPPARPSSWAQPNRQASRGASRAASRARPEASWRGHK